MQSLFLSYFSDPYTGDSLHFYEFEKSGENIVHGLFVNTLNGTVYALCDGVPIFLKNSIPSAFLNRFAEPIKNLKNKYPNLFIPDGNEKLNWSFSLEWEAHKDLELETTWGMTTASRFEQFLLETQSNQTEIEGKLIVDAGCGNGKLTDYIAAQKAIVIGVDLSNSVFAAEKNRKSVNCCFIQGDLQNLPFQKNQIDIVVSNGVIHHTPNTENTFNHIAGKIKPNGKFYIWLYSVKGSFLWKLKRRFFDVYRIINCRMPDFIQKANVWLMENVLYYTYRMMGKKVDKKTLHVDMYDSITPRWRHYHSPEEISRWYYEEGFGPITLTHWDNRYGFGAYGVKNGIRNTPGENFVAQK